MGAYAVDWPTGPRNLSLRDGRRGSYASNFGPWFKSTRLHQEVK